jgi:hypothetical protein
MRHRVLAVFRAGFEAQWARGAWPAAPLVMHGSIAAVLCALVKNDLPPFAYALFAFSVSASLIALPLLGEFGALLRADPAREWIEALPVTKFELRAGRTLLLGVSIALLSLAALVPAAVFAPSAMSIAARIALVAWGLAQALGLAAVLLAVQSALGERAETLLVILQTALVAGIVIGLVAGLRVVPAIRGLSSPARGAPELAWFPPAWFAAQIADGSREINGEISAQIDAWWRSAAWIATAAACAILAAAPLPPAPRARRTGGWLALALAPARALATRIWVRSSERAAFDLVFDALPLEREFVLRTYPMFGIPLAFLFVGARGETGPAHDGLLAVLLFTPATYLPVLLVHVPASASARARWILECAPISPRAIANGALKAVAVRFILPLYVLLFAIAWSQVDASFAARLALPGACVSLIVVRLLYPMCVGDLPLSVAPDEIEAKMDWTGTLLTLAIVLTIAAMVAFAYITTIGRGLAVAAALITIEWAFDRAVPNEEAGSS